MSCAPAPPPAESELQYATDDARSKRPRTIVLGVVLVLAVIVAGAPELAAPWLPGDEFIFIVGNPDVNPAADLALSGRSLATRLGAICTRVHEDLYQPIPILTYALEWELSGGDPLSFRRTDLLLHALNALLLWAVLRALLKRIAPQSGGLVTTIAWSLALLWALHPMHVTAYAADMGRTHLLSATFTLLALLLHLRALNPGRGAYFIPAFAALLLAMLCKPIPGWILPAFVLEALCLGGSRAVRSVRVYAVGAACLFFAILTIWSTAREGLLEDAARGLFGDPVARSALAVWIHFRNLIVPFRLSYWQLPDPRTGWSFPLIWVGSGLALASMIHAAYSWRRPETRVATFGWAWCWGLLLPVIGLVGAREAAALDRCFYQPLMGMAVVLGVALSRTLQRLQPPAATRTQRCVLAATTGIGLVLLLCTLPQCAITRSNIRRATHLVRLNPGDPRALEALAAAYDFAQNHALLGSDLAHVPQESTQAEYYHRLWHETLIRATDSPSLAYFFPGPGDRGPFHRRMSYRFLRAGDAARSLEQAQAAEQLLPDEYRTWVRLAHAYQALQRFDEAGDAYAHAELLLPADPETRAVHFTNYAYLLMFDLERDADACPRFADALETGLAPLPAKLGMAACQIRYGDGALGFQLISEVLQADPTNERAGLVLAEYHLRSHHWEAALKVYEALLRDDPTNYAALRGFQEVCLQAGRRNDATLAWAEALRREPGRREFESYLIWSLALAGADSAPAAARDLLAADPNNPLACFALLLDAVRKGDEATAVDWVRRASAGEPIPKAREFERAATALQFLIATKEISADAIIPWAVIYTRDDFPSSLRDQAREKLAEYLRASSESPWKALAQRVGAELSDQGPAR